MCDLLLDWLHIWDRLRQALRFSAFFRPDEKADTAKVKTQIKTNKQIIPRPPTQKNVYRALKLDEWHFKARIAEERICERQWFWWHLLLGLLHSLKIYLQIDISKHSSISMSCFKLVLFWSWLEEEDGVSFFLMFSTTLAQHIWISMLAKGLWIMRLLELKLFLAQAEEEDVTV